MNEIDFLPEWYKSGRRRKFRYSTQYIALACMFSVMMVWIFVSLNSISTATAKLAKMASDRSDVQNASKQFTKIKNELTELQKKAHIIGQINSKIDVANVLAEMSFLIGENIVLDKVELIAEKFKDRQPSKTDSGSVVRVVGSELDKRSAAGGPLGNVRFKVVMNGIAADSSDLAALVRKLEDSPYFCLVYPSICRNRTLQIPANSTNSAEDFQVSEFEISCYLANYRQEKL